MSSGQDRLGGRRSHKSSQRHLDSAMKQHSQQVASGYDNSQHFDMSQIHDSISSISSDQIESQIATRSRVQNSNFNNREVPESGIKKERIKNLWGKVGKQSILQAKQLPEGSKTQSKWDQVLNPLMMQKQANQRRQDPATPVSSTYLNMIVGGEVGGGSGFYGQPGNTTMECDCGDDSCQRCNLMLNMGSNF